MFNDYDQQNIALKVAIFIVVMCGFYFIINNFTTNKPYPIYRNNSSDGGNRTIIQQQPQCPSVDNVYDAIHKFDTAKVVDPLQDPITRNSLLNYGLPNDSYRQVGTLKCIFEDEPLTKRELYDARYGAEDEITIDEPTSISPSNQSPPQSKKKKCKKCKKDKKVKVETFINNQYNEILPLFGMQSNVNTNIWFYYTIVSDGNNSIKIMINPPNNSGTTELWTGSVVYIPELNKTYEAIVNQTIFMSYNPFQ